VEQELKKKENILLGKIIIILLIILLPNGKTIKKMGIIGLSLKILKKIKVKTLRTSRSSILLLPLQTLRGRNQT